MYVYAMHRTCSSKKNFGNEKNFELHNECEKLEAMVEIRLKQGKSLSSDILLRQSSLIDKLIVEEMLLSEVGEK